MCSEVSEKTSTALTLFIFCNPSNVLARFGPSERNSCEVNSQQHLEKAPSTSRGKETQERVCEYFQGSENIQVPQCRSDVKSERELSSTLKIACFFLQKSGNSPNKL